MKSKLKPVQVVPQSGQYEIVGSHGGKTGKESLVLDGKYSLQLQNQVIIIS